MTINEQVKWLKDYSKKYIKCFKQNADYQDFVSDCFTRFSKTIKKTDNIDLRKLVDWEYVELMRRVLGRNGKKKELLDISYVDPNNIVLELNGHTTSTNSDMEMDCAYILSLLTPKYKRLFEMFFIEGYSLEQIAKVNNYSSTWVSLVFKSEINKVREKLGIKVDTHERLVGWNGQINTNRYEEMNAPLI